MLRLTSLKNAAAKRTLQARFAQTQATPVPMVLDPAFNRLAGALNGSDAITGALAAIMPGMVAFKKAGRKVVPAGATTGSLAVTPDTERAFGLFGQFVGGQLDDLGDSADISVWQGVGSHWEVLAPAFDDTGLGTPAGAEDGTDEAEVYMGASAKSQLKLRAQASQTGSAQGDVARLIERLSSKAIVIQLLV